MGEWQQLSLINALDKTMYTVLTDFHHASLLQSFILLFEKRLKGEVYRPIGIDWATQGFWKVYDHPATQQQYLGIGANTPDGTPPLNEVVGSLSDYRYLCHDIDSGKTNKAITLEGFMTMKFDIVIASIPDHIEPFKQLCRIHPSQPKLIFQIGNQWDGNNTALNIMASAKMAPIDGTNFISYHQEFNTKLFFPGFPINEFSADAASPEKNISSFVNVFNGQSHFSHDWELFEEIERSMPDWKFKSYGGQCRNGAVGPDNVLAQTMRNARFIWHTKAGGDGYGHIVHNSAAVARPLITKRSYYAGKLGEDLMIDGITCINIDNLNPFEIVAKIRYYSQPEEYRKMCLNVYENFKKQVDFDKEFLDLTNFLKNLL